MGVRKGFPAQTSHAADGAKLCTDDSPAETSLAATAPNEDHLGSMFLGDGRYCLFGLDLHAADDQMH